MNPLEAESITTARLDLVPLGIGHAEEMAEVLSDPALHAFVGGVPDSAEALRARYERLAGGCPEPGVSWLNWVVRLRSEGRLTGTVQATVTASGRERVAEIAWVVGTAWQGRGIATEAARGLVGWLDRQSVRTVTAHIHPEHRASEAVAAAAGLAVTDVWQDGERGWLRRAGTHAADVRADSGAEPGS